MRQLTGRAGVAAISFAGSSGGLAYVARLLCDTLARWQQEPVWSLALEPARYGTVSPWERCRFGAHVISAQILGQVDWLAFNHVGVAQIQRMVPSRMRRPYMVFVHDVEAWDPELSPNRVATLRSASLRVANSRFTAARVSKAHPSIGPVVPCPLGLLAADPEGAAPSKPPEGLELEGDGTAIAPNGSIADRVAPVSVLIVGRLQSAERYKGHDELLESWPDVVARVPTAQLVVVGLGDDRPRLQEKARALGVASHVLFCGFVSTTELAALWTKVAIFAMPSAREGFGLVYLEAMRAGLPCIGSTSDAAGDIIVDHQTGLLVDRSSRAALTEAVVTLLTNESLRRAMGEAARRRFLAEFTADRFAGRLRAIVDGAPAMQVDH